MNITCFASNVYQLAICRLALAFYKPVRLTIVYCEEFINKNNPFLSYIDGLVGVELIPVSEKKHNGEDGSKAVTRCQNVLDAVIASDLSIFGDPYLYSQRFYIGLAKEDAMLEDSPTLFSYYRYRSTLSLVRRWIGEYFMRHPRFEDTALCIGLSKRNNCQSKSYLNLLEKVSEDTLSLIKDEIKAVFASEFSKLASIFNENNTVLLLTQPLASDNDAKTIDQQIDYYMKARERLNECGFRVFFKLHPRDIAQNISYPLKDAEILNFSAPMELFEDEIKKSFSAIASCNSYTLVESTSFSRIDLKI
ncbi:polysialyltransferase family glycosyltransferase [Chromobacterium violaceum]|uniref:polysialyltransferase family glycosyltransferase n=1 Tax=Chromobacterium violaceum TaxID=536 RepID=UPI000AEAED41|nr:polysialyltransferase family glycosyltransferase [Chromobacterium violaceum]